MASNKAAIAQKIANLPAQPSGDKMMQAVVMTAGPAARMLELTRTGAARKGVRAWVDDEPVTWLTTDRSALMPVKPGTRIVTLEISGKKGQDWFVFVSKPADASGSTGDDLPASGRDVAEFGAIIP